MFQAFERTETQYDGIIWRFVRFLLHCEKEIFARSKTWTIPRAVRSFQSEWINATREEETLFVHYEKILERWSVPKFSARQWMDRRTLSTYWFSHGHWFLKYSNRKERTRYENTYTLGVNGQGPKPGPMKKRADYPQAVNKVLVLRRQAENPNPYVPEHFTIPTATNWRTWKIGTAMEKLEMDQLVSIFFLLFNLVYATRKASMARIMYFLSRCRKKHSDFFKKFRSQATANPFVSDGECKLETLHRSDLSRATHAFFLVVCTWLKIEVFCCMQSVCFLKIIPSHPCFTAPCLTRSCPRLSLHPFLHVHLVLLPLSLSLLYPSLSPSAVTLQGGFCFGRLAEQSPLAFSRPQVSHPSQQQTHSDHLTFEKRQSRHDRWRSRDLSGCVWCLRHNRRGTVDLTTVFPGARLECYPIRCLWFSDI